MSRRRPVQSTRTAAPARGRRPRRPGESASGAVTTIDPRGSRRRRIRRTALLVVAGLAVTLYAGHALLYGSWLRVDSVEVLGAHHESAAAVVSASGLNAHPPMISVSGAEVSSRLKELPWVAGVTVIKRWPHTIELRVAEAVPVAVAFNATGAVRYVDQHGRDLGPAPRHADLPTLSMVTPSARPWPFSGPGRAGAWVASQLRRQPFESQVSRILVTQAGTVRLQLTSPLTFLLGRPTDLPAKFTAIASVIGGATLRPGDVVDVTVPRALAVSGPTPK